LKGIFFEQEKILKTYLQKHIEFKKIYKLTYYCNEVNQNQVKILDEVVNNCVNESINKNRLLSINRGKNELRVNSCKLRIDNIKNTETENSTINLNFYAYSNMNLRESNDYKKENEFMIKRTFSEKFSIHPSVDLNNQLSTKQSLNLINKNSDNNIFNNLRTPEKNKPLKIIEIANDCKEIRKTNLNNFFSLNKCNSNLTHQSSMEKNMNSGNLKNKKPNFLSSSKKSDNQLKKRSMYIDDEVEYKKKSRPITVFNKFRIDPTITKTAKKWVKYKNSLIPKYSSGHFCLPLVSNQGN